MTLEEFTEDVRQKMYNVMSESKEDIDRFMETDDAKFALRDAYEADKGNEEEQKKRVWSCVSCLYWLYE